MLAFIDDYGRDDVFRSGRKRAAVLGGHWTVDGGWHAAVAVAVAVAVDNGADKR